MRTWDFNLYGKTHKLCFTARVQRACCEKFGSMEEMYNALSSEDEVAILDNSVWLLAEMMKAGDKYAKNNGIANDNPMSIDDILDSCDVHSIRGAIVMTINNGKRTTVEVDNNPKAEATQGN